MHMALYLHPSPPRLAPCAVHPVISAFSSYIPSFPSFAAEVKSKKNKYEMFSIAMEMVENVSCRRDRKQGMKWFGGLRESPSKTIEGVLVQGRGAKTIKKRPARTRAAYLQQNGDRTAHVRPAPIFSCLGQRHSSPRMLSLDDETTEAFEALAHQSAYIFSAITFLESVRSECRWQYSVRRRL